MLRRTVPLWLLLFLSVLQRAGGAAFPSQQPLVFAEDSSPFLDPQNGVAEADLVTRAFLSNPGLAAERSRIAVAAAEVTQARLRKNPSLMLGGLKEVDGPDNSVRVGGALPLELYGRRARRTEVAERNLDATREAVADKERLLAGEVRTRFGDTLAAVRNLLFTEQLLAANREFLKLTADRVREGATPALDADEVRVEVNRIDALRLENQAKADIALLALKEAVGMQPEEPLRLKGSLEIPRRTFDRATLTLLASTHRPDLAAQRAEEARASADLQQQAALAKPDASLSGGYERPSSGFSQLAVDPSGALRPIRQTFNYATFGLEITLPAFDRNQGAIAAGTAEVSAARSRTRAVDLTLRHEVAQSLLRYNAAQARVSLYGTGVRDQAAKNLDVVRQIYRYGRSTLLDVIAEQRRFIDIETGYTGVLAEAYAARIALEQAVGTDLP